MDSLEGHLFPLIIEARKRNSLPEGFYGAYRVYLELLKLNYEINI